MARLGPTLGLAVVLTVLAACAAEVTPTTESAGSSPAPSSSTHSAHDALERIDARKPLPLLPMMANHQKANMRDHLTAVQEVVAAVATDDFAGAERAAARIGSSESMGQMCTHMGSGAPGFTEQALDFHRVADRIGVAARERDRSRVLIELGATLQRCTSCHQVWKQQIVDEATWDQLTGASAPHGDAVHPR